MSDITKIAELRTKDHGDWDDWPYPALEITSRVTGQLRERILAKLERRPEDSCEVTIIETHVSGGYSEYTQDDDYAIELQIDGVQSWRNEYSTSTESAMAAFLKWVGTAS